MNLVYGIHLMTCTNLISFLDQWAESRWSHRTAQIVRRYPSINAKLRALGIIYRYVVFLLYEH